VFLLLAIQPSKPEMSLLPLSQPQLGLVLPQFSCEPLLPLELLLSPLLMPLVPPSLPP
jgi:hypothetical protein